MYCPPAFAPLLGFICTCESVSCSIARKPLCSIAFPSMHHLNVCMQFADATHSQVVFLRITPPSSHPIRHTVLYEINTYVYVFPVTIVTMLLQCCNNAVTRACACDFRRQASVASDTYITTHVHIRHTYTYVYTLLLQNTMSCKYTWRILNPVQALPIGSL